MVGEHPREVVLQALVPEAAKVELVDESDEVLFEHLFDSGVPFVTFRVPGGVDLAHLRAKVTVEGSDEPELLHVDRLLTDSSDIPIIKVSRPTASDPEVSELLEQSPEKIGGSPVDLPLPVNPFRPRQTFRYFQIAPGLAAGTWGSGEAIDYEMSWRSLGWALDDWVSTRSLDPMQTVATAHASVNQDSTVQQRGGTANHEGTGSQHETIEASDQRLDSTTSVRGHARSLGIGASVSSSLDASLKGPAGLVEAKFGKLLGGALQAGVGVSTTTGKSSSTASVGRRIVSAVQDAAQRQRITESEAGRAAHHGMTDDRLVTASSNPNPSSENVCRYTIVHQWRVRTRKVRVIPIKLVPIADLTVDIDLPTAVANRSVLLDHLLDERYAGLLATVEIADGVEAPDPPSPQPITAINFDIEFSDRPKAKDGTILLRIHLAEGEPLVASRTGKFEAAEHWRGSIPLPSGVNLTIASLTSIEFEFSNKGIVADTSTTIARGSITWRAGGETADRLLATVPTIRVPYDEKRYLTIAPVQPGFVAPAMPRDVSALLAHLNANLAHYRTEIDLARHPVARFVALGEQARDLTDMEPIGIVGAHLAFEAPPSGTSSGDSEEPIDDIVSIATGATWEEAVPGGSQIRAAGLDAQWTGLPGTDGKSVVWPPIAPLQMPGDLSSPQDDTTLTATDHASPEPPDLPSMEDVTAMADKLNAALKELADAAKASAAPAAAEGPTPSSADEPAGDAPAAAPADGAKGKGAPDQKA